jgi:hypothetical protein
MDTESVLKLDTYQTNTILEKLGIGTSKKLIDGYWYVKLADIKLGNV